MPAYLASMTSLALNINIIVIWTMLLANGATWRIRSYIALFAANTTGKVNIAHAVNLS
jgi:hypothetical protein